MWLLGSTSARLLLWHRGTALVVVRGACSNVRSTLLCFGQKSVKMDLNRSSENSCGRKEPDLLGQRCVNKKANNKQLA